MAGSSPLCTLFVMYTVIFLVALVAGISAQCLDQNANCPTWAKNGFCTNPFYSSLVSSCQKSCNQCPVGKVGDCGPNDKRAVGPVFGGSCPSLGYGPNAAGDLCCPTVNLVDMWYQIGPAVGGMCPVGYVVVYGFDYDTINQGECVDLNS